MKDSLPLPPVLSSKLSDFRRRVWIVKLAEGLLAAVFGVTVSWLLVLGLDRLFETPVWLRGLLLAAGAAVPGLGLPLQWHRWVWRQRRLKDAARLLRWKFPGLGDQLLGIVELAREGAGQGRSERLVQAAMAQADEAVKEQDFSKAVPRARHRQWGLAAAGSVALTVAAFTGIHEAAANALVRWLMPWKNTERFTFARLEPLPNPLVVPLAEPFTLPVTLSPETRWKPGNAEGLIAGQPDLSTERREAVYAMHFPPQSQDADLFVKAGDVRRTIRLEPRPRPELTALKVHLKLPEYLQYKTEPVADVRGGSVSILKGATVIFSAEASRELAAGEIDGQPAKLEEGKISGAPQVIQEPREVTFTWRDSLGLTARTPLVLRVQPAEDEAPKIVARRETPEQVVLDSEVVIFEVSASDDFGIRRMGLEWRGMDDGTDAAAAETQGSKTAVAGAPETKQLETRATFSAARENVAPQTLEVRAWAEDYLPGRDRSRSAAFILHVLSKTDHALWVTQQMGKWLEASRETYEREQQLHQTNRELRALSAEELDRPENRRKVAQQSSAENANAERLGALTRAGRNLVEQATKNPEFDAARLESLATLLKSLQDIAANRMPEVASLLKQSAEAKADAKPGSPNAQAQGQPADSAPAGEAKPGENATAENNQNQAPAGKPGLPEESLGAPQIAAGAQPPPGEKPSSPADPNAAAKEPAPSIRLTESTMSKPETGEQKPGEPKPPGAGKLGLPSNSLAALPGQKPADSKPESSAQQRMEEGVTGQRELLAEFAKVSDQLSEILGSLEASTFVKRLKAASREQMQLASGISQKTLDAFGIIRDQPAIAAPEKKPDEPAAAKAEEPKPVETAGSEKKAEAAFVTAFAPEAFNKAKDQSMEVKVIQSDLEAYFQRKPDQHFKRVLSEMKQIKVVQELARVGERAADNLSGNAIHGAEFWADTLDRWAEDMVKAGQCSNCSTCSSDSLPPEIVLKVMQALRDEMKLRDETRELNGAQAAVEEAEYNRRTGLLAKEQERIAEHTQGASEDIAALPEGARKFGKELRLLQAVGQVMDETTGILAAAETGARAIAAETEAIELLLETKRQNPNGGGGGGSDPGGGGRAARASSAALADLGPGGDADAVVQARPVGQATGHAGREFPEEFKTGLDAYFNKLEESRSTP